MGASITYLPLHAAVEVPDSDAWGWMQATVHVVHPTNSSERIKREFEMLRNGTAADFAGMNGVWTTPMSVSIGPRRFDKLLGDGTASDLVIAARVSRWSFGVGAGSVAGAGRAASFVSHYVSPGIAREQPICSCRQQQTGKIAIDDVF